MLWFAYAKLIRCAAPWGPVPPTTEGDTTQMQFNLQPYGLAIRLHRVGGMHWLHIGRIHLALCVSRRQPECDPFCPCDSEPPAAEDSWAGSEVAKPTSPVSKPIWDVGVNTPKDCVAIVRTYGTGEYRYQVAEYDNDGEVYNRHMFVHISQATLAAEELAASRAETSWQEYLD